MPAENPSAWWLAIRPKTLPAAASGIVMGAALAWQVGAFNLLTSIAALLCALLLQIGSNLANDVYDHERGTDSHGRLGPTRVTQSGMLSPQQVKRGMWISFFLAAIIGLYLARLAGWQFLLLGAAAILAAIAYTAGPFAFGYHGLGEMFVFIFFGPVAVAGTYYLQVRAVSQAAWCMSISIGLIVTAILIVNNLRDIHTDRAAGKRTLAVRVGASWSRALYLLCIAIAYGLLLLCVLLKIIPPTALLALLSIFYAWKAAQVVLNLEGRALNRALAATGQTALAFSVLAFLGLLIAG